MDAEVTQTSRSDGIRTLRSVTNHHSLGCFLFCLAFCCCFNLRQKAARFSKTAKKRKNNSEKKKANLILFRPLLLALPWPHMLEASVKPSWHEAKCPSSVLRHPSKRTDGRTDMARHCSRVASRRLQLRKQAIKPSQRVWLPARQRS